MQIRYPVTYGFTFILGMCIAALTVVWSFGHLLGLVGVLAGLFALPMVARREARHK